MNGQTLKLADVFVHAQVCAPLESAKSRFCWYHQTDGDLCDGLTIKGVKQHQGVITRHFFILND